MTPRKFLVAAAAALMLAGPSGAEAGERWRGPDPDGGAHAAHARAAGGNLARTSQTGSRNVAAIRQHGAGNVAHTVQRGDDNEAEIGQTGDNNRSRIIQVGDGHDATLHQDGGQRSNIVQVNKGAALVDIRTGHGRGKRPVRGAGRPTTGPAFR